MVRTAKLLLFLVLNGLGAMISVWAEDSTTGGGLLGYWLCESGDCPDEAIELADNDGGHTYNSWLHDRPSAVDGQWTLNGARLVISCCEDVEYTYNVIEVGEERLVLQDADTPSEEIILHRPAAAGRREESAAAPSSQAAAP